MFSKVEISPDQATSVRSRVFGENNPPTYQQKIYLFKAGVPYPIEVEIRLPDGVTGYEAGQYIINTESNIAQGRYGDLSLAPFSSFSLIKVDASIHEAIDKLEAQFTDTLKKFLNPPAVAAVPVAAKG